MDIQSLPELLAGGQKKLDMGDKEAAYREAVRATELDPHNEAAWWLRAQAAENADEGIACLERVIQLNPHNLPARDRLTRLQTQTLREAVKNNSGGRWSWLEDINWLGLAIAFAILLVLVAGIYWGYPTLNSFLASAATPTTRPTSANAFQFPATWTPTATPTPTLTPTRTATGTATNTPTVTPKDTPTGTPTPLPTRVPPMPKPVVIAPPTVPPPPTYRGTTIGCYHSGGTFVEGTISDETGAPLNGVRVRLSDSPGGKALVEDTSGSNWEHGAGYYLLSINPNGSKVGTWSVWIVRDDGSTASAPQSITTNRYKEGNAAACWRAEINFVRQ